MKEKSYIIKPGKVANSIDTCFLLLFVTSLGHKVAISAPVAPEGQETTRGLAICCRVHVLACTHLVAAVVIGRAATAELAVESVQGKQKEQHPTDNRDCPL